MHEFDIKEHFSTNFLKIVACELRFPPYLNIEKRIPDIQESIRDSLPNYEIRKKLIDFRISDGPQVFDDSGGYNFQDFNETIFSNEGKQHALKISINSISLSVKNYDSYNNFINSFNDLIVKFNSIIEVGHYTRIGLRYINEFHLKKKESYSDQIIEYFNPLITGSRLRKYHLNAFDSVILERSTDGIKIRTKNALGLNENGVPVYVIDIDVFKDKIKLISSDYESITEDLHSIAVSEFHSNIIEAFREKLRGNSTMNPGNTSTGSDDINLRPSSTQTVGWYQGESSTLMKENQRLWSQNEKLIENNDSLTKKLVDLAQTYERLQERTEKTLQVTNQKISSFENEINQLRVEITKLRRAKINTFKIPKAWIDEDYISDVDQEE